MEKLHLEAEVLFTSINAKPLAGLYLACIEQNLEW